MPTSKELPFYGLKQLPNSPEDGVYFIAPTAESDYDLVLVANGIQFNLNAAKQAVLDQVESELDAKIALRALASQVYTKAQVYTQTEIDAITQQTLASITSGFRGVLTPTDPAPTLDGVYKPTVTQNEAGTPIAYPGAGGLTVNTAEGGEDYGTSVEFIKNGASWVKVNTPLPQAENKLDAWEPIPYLANKQRTHNGILYEAVVNTTAAQEPGVVAETIWRPLDWRVNIKQEPATIPLKKGDLISNTTGELFIGKNDYESPKPTEDIAALKKIRFSPRNVINIEGFFGKL